MIVQEGGLDRLPELLREEGLANSRAFILTDSNVLKLHGEKITKIFNNAGIGNHLLVMPAGEQNKTFQQAGAFVEELSGYKATRSEPIIAFGGGVVGDLAGFVASIYNRGVPIVHVPTTLLAMVDSSIGGKTGVDHGGKNKTGTFYQPRLVVSDSSFLSTLPERVYTQSFGEIVKYAMLDVDFFTELEKAAHKLRKYKKSNDIILGKIISRCVKQKSDLIAKDPYEMKSNGRLLLNYGHTLGHSLEDAGEYKELQHGEAVAIGMTFAANLAVQQGLAGQGIVKRQKALLETLGLPIEYFGAAKADKILDQIAKDKKNTASTSTRFVLPTKIGHMIVEEIDNKVASVAVKDFLQL